MVNTYPSIFNDVIGPVMRGPSASHCAAALRIGRIARDLMDGNIKEVLIEFDKQGSLATTHKTQGSDMGLFGGLLGWEATERRLPFSEQILKDSGIIYEIRTGSYGDIHPNTYRLSISNDTEKYEIIALSTGGGAIEITKVDGIDIHLSGDYFETWIYLKSHVNDVKKYLEKHFISDYTVIHQNTNTSFIQVKADRFIPEKFLNELYDQYQISSVKKISPVLPVLSSRDMSVPFLSAEEMINFNKAKNLSLWELAIEYESRRGKMSGEDVFKKMEHIVEIISDSVKEGLSGTDYNDRILTPLAGHYKKLSDNGSLPGGDLFNMMISNVSALMEVKSSMGIIVAAPTAGSCAGLPAAVIAVAEVLKLSQQDMVKGLLAAGVIGVLIAARTTFAAEVCGCQAECGASSGMAAAALAGMSGGTLEQALCAASMALQNTLGMICDPVANRVEVPCLGKNILAATNALACANLALAGFDEVIPLDEVIETMDHVGKSIPFELRCTALGGLSVTKTSKDIAKNLDSTNSS